MKKSILIILIFTVFQTCFAFAGSPYIRKSIGKEGKKDSVIKQDKKDLEVIEEKDLFPYRPISTWEGERLIFLPEKKKFQQYGYQDTFYDENGKELTPLDYNEYVGRIAKVISVDQEKKQVKLKLEDNSQILILGYGSDDACGGGMALFADIDNARKKWLGKTLLYKHSYFPLKTYNENTGETGCIILPHRGKNNLKVIDIVAGWGSNHPVRFILKTPSGEEGFVDVSLSGTFSCGDPSGHLSTYGLDKYFSFKLPKKSLKSPEKASVISCYELGYLYGRCETRSMAGLSCESGTDIVIPERCRGKAETQKGIEAGIKSVSE